MIQVGLGTPRHFQEELGYQQQSFSSGSSSRKKAIVGRRFEELPVGSPPNPSGSRPSFPWWMVCAPGFHTVVVLSPWQPQTPPGGGRPSRPCGSWSVAWWAVSWLLLGGARCLRTVPPSTILEHHPPATVDFDIGIVDAIKNNCDGFSTRMRALGLAVLLSRCRKPSTRPTTQAPTQ